MMARLNKFASVNLNDSYGKPDRAGSANSNSSSNSSSSGKPRISSPGGMLVLSRPGRSQPPSPKPGQPRLGIPSPVNLPSLKRESGSSDPPPPSSPPHPGSWTKAASPPLPGWIKAESPIETSHLQHRAELSRSLDSVGETLKAVTSGGKPDVYAPPALRAMQTATTNPRPLPPTPLLEKPPAVIRGEDFPALQAVVARPPTPPQHPRQRDLQQKQREKHQESKEQQLRLQQLSQAQVQKEIQGNSYPATSENSQCQPSLSLRPLGRQQVSQKVNVEASGPDPSLHLSTTKNRLGMQDPIAYSGGSLSVSSPAGLPNEGDAALSRSPPVPSQSVGKADDLIDSCHSFRPQYRNYLPSNQGSPIADRCRSGLTTGSELSWFSLSRRDFTPPPRNGDHSKFPGDSRTSIMEDMGQISLDFRSASFGRESYCGKEASFFREGSSGGIGREDVNMQSEGFGSREITDSRITIRSSALVHDAVPRIEGFYSQRSFGRETYSRESKEGSSRLVRENTDVLQRDIRDSRDNYSRDLGDAFDRDVREAYHRDSRNVYTRDVREVYNQEIPMNRHVGYSNYGINNDDNLWGGSSRYTESPHGRGGIHSPGIAPTYNTGPEHDTHYGRRYGPQGFGDEYFTREGRSYPDSRALHGLYMGSTAFNGSPETIGSRRVRSPAPGNGSFEPVKELLEIRFEKPQKSSDEDLQIKFEDKRVVTKVSAGNDFYGTSVSVQRPHLKRESSQGPTTRIAQINTIKNVDDEKSSGKELKKQCMPEDERRKEAAKLKLLELEMRIARRAAEEGKKDEIGSARKDPLEAAAPKQQEAEQMLDSLRFESDYMGAQLLDREVDIEEDLSSKFARPSLASSKTSWNYKSPSEGLVAQEQEFCLVSEIELNQDRKVVRSSSPSSWRKDIGGGPTSKLFSSPYVESGGGFRRPSDGGTYKLF